MLTHVPDSSCKVPLTLGLQEDCFEEADGERNSEEGSSRICVKTELADPDEVAVDEAKFSETLSEVTLKTLSEGEVDLDEIQILSESVHFSENADVLKATGFRESLKRIRNCYIDLA